MYPATWHKAIMINGFMLSFICGFLMTAVPKFTKTDYAKPWEIVVTLMSITLAALLLACSLVSAHYIVAGLANAVILTFVIKRFLMRQENPPYTFLFIGFSLLLWCFCNLLYGASNSGLLSLGVWQIAVERLLYEGVVLGLILGVGARLLPGILGWQDIVRHQKQKYEQNLPFIKVVPKNIILIAVFFYISYFLEHSFVKLAYAMRTAIVFYIAMKFWNIFRLPKKRTRLTFGIWACTWMFVVSSALPWFWQYPMSHGAHSYFIGGFSLLTLLVATRVSLAHSTQGLDLESSSKALPTIVILMVATALTRLTAIIWPRIYLSHLSYAAITWLIAVVLWLIILKPFLLAGKYTKEA